MSEKEGSSSGQAPIKEGSSFPVGDFYKVLDGYTILKSQNFWEAILAVETGNGSKQIRLYRWRNKNGEWKVDLARFNISSWDIDAIAGKVKEFKNKYMGRCKILLGFLHTIASGSLLLGRTHAHL
ncbi:MAG: hypothetical protein ACP5LS_00255 [Thermoprotei archaeon]